MYIVAAFSHAGHVAVSHSSCLSSVKKCANMSAIKCLAN